MTVIRRGKELERGVTSLGRGETSAMFGRFRRATERGKQSSDVTQLCLLLWENGVGVHLISSCLFQ